MILVDTSVWIDHVQRAEDRLVELLADEQVYSHPFVAGELAVGNFRQRQDLLTMHMEIPQALVAEPHELLTFIDANRIYGRGIGYIDAHLLASMQLMDDVWLWTRDKRLVKVAKSLKLAVIEEYAH